MAMISMIFLVFVSSALIRDVFACTTLVVGKQASTDGSVLVTHSDDGEGNPDARLCWVSAKDHPLGSLRQVYYDTEDYPRYVGYDRCAIYEPASGQTPSRAIGTIPQVAHTYAYYEATYGIVNEHGLSIGESTCSGVFATNASQYGGKALLSIDELSRIALERETSARAAVKLMGQLAEKYGFYGSDSFEGSAESLIVGDPDEAFYFHILPDPSGTSAIWAAQRVPDDHVGVVANMFVIRDINFTDNDSFLFSESVKTVAVDRGWWSPASKRPLDFTAIYSAGEYAHKFYSGRRVWGAYRRFGIELPDEYGNLRYDAVYPVSARPPTLGFSARDLFAIHRDYYQGSKYDMTKGLAAGPWGDPDRWTTAGVKTGQGPEVKGNWERSIAIFRTSEAHVVQSRRAGQRSILWFGPHASSSTCFAPLAAIGTSVPASYTNGDPNVLSRDSAYWAHKYVFNVAKLKYSYAQQEISALQTKLEEEGERLVLHLDASCGQSCDPAVLDVAYGKHAARILEAFWGASDQIITKYGDGWLNDGNPMGYPNWWLKAVGFENGPPPPPKAELSTPDCDDARVQQCVSTCPSRGFSACAADCLHSCTPQRGRTEEIVV